MKKVIATTKTITTADHISGEPKQVKVYTAEATRILAIEINRELLLGRKEKLQAQIDDIESALALMPEANEPE